MAAKSIIHKKNLRTVLCTFLFFFSLSAYVSPIQAFTIGEEKNVGKRLLFSVRKAFTLIDDPDLTAYITGLGEDVLRVAGVQYFDYHFFIIRDKAFNAFAAPSGLIFFHSGLIGAMNNENELMSVLAHEIGHIVKRHLAARMEKGKFTSITSFGLAAAAAAFGGPAASALVTGALATGQSINLHFSRQDEEEADLLAYGWMKKLHRNPEGQAKMLETMRRIARYRSEKLPQYLLTHPDPENRLHLIESFIAIDREEIETFENAADDVAFLRFKYRVLSQLDQTKNLKAHLANTLATHKEGTLEHTMSLYGLSQVALVENNWERGIKLLARVMARYPDRMIFYADKGVLLAAGGQNAKAEHAFKKALSYDVSDMYSAYNLGLLYSQSKRTVEAKDMFTRVMRNYPEYSKVYFQLGQLETREGNYGLSNYYLGKYNLYEGKLKLALSSFHMALKNKDLGPKIRDEIKELMEKIGELQEK